MMMPSSTSSSSTSTSSTSSSSASLLLAAASAPPRAADGAGAVVMMDRIRRVELLRAELDRSLKMAAAAAASLNSAASAKRSPLCILFRADNSVQIQFSGSARSSPNDLITKPRSTNAAGDGGGCAVSRFTVSPTPNAVPPAAFGVMSPKCRNNNSDGMTAVPTMQSNTPMSSPPATAWSSSLSVLTETRQNGGTTGTDSDGDKRADAIASAAIAAAELLAPLSSTAPTEDNDKTGKKDSENDTIADFVLPSPSSTSSSLSLVTDGGGDEGAHDRGGGGGTGAMPFKQLPLVGGAATAVGAGNTVTSVGAASSPASSVDSGVASPGAAGDDFSLLNSLASTFRSAATTATTTTTHSSNRNNNNKESANAKLEQYIVNSNNLVSPCWATVPRTRRRIFNFSGWTTTTIDNDGGATAYNANNNGSSPLIDALALSSPQPQQLTVSSGNNKTTTTTTGTLTGGGGIAAVPSAALCVGAMTGPVPASQLTLQKPPMKKKNGQQPIITTTVQQTFPLCQQPKSEVSFSSLADGYKRTDNNNSRSSSNNDNNNMGITVIPGALASAPPAGEPNFVTSSPSALRMEIDGDKLVIANNTECDVQKVDADQTNGTARRTPLSVVQTEVAVQRHHLSDSTSYNNNKHGIAGRRGSGDNENNGVGSGTDSDTALDTHMAATYGCDGVGGGLPPRSATVPPLRSILKKPRGAQQQTQAPHPDSTLMMMTKMAAANGGAQQQQQMLLQQRMFNSASSPLPRNHLRRVPTRIVLERSVSDSLLDDAAIPDDQFAALQHSAAAAFNASILRRLSASSPCGRLGSFDEQAEEVDTTSIAHHMTEQYQQNNSNNSGSTDNTSTSSSSCPSSCSSETIDTDGSGQSATAAPIVKKRVSFSECVHARYFRSNSSILGQRKKNEKKARKRTGRRCNSDIVHPTSSTDNNETSSSLQQQQQSSSQSHKHHHEDCDESCPWIAWKH